jgi:nucleotide-binding universal stress UspA family protein
MKTMLVPLDGSPRSETVLPIVVALAGGTEYRVALFSVWEGLPGQPEDMRQEQARQLRTDGMMYFRAYLENVVQGLVKEGVEASTDVHCGRPAAEILVAMRELQADMIAMASKGRGGVTDRVVTASQAPVLVLGPRLLEVWPPRQVHASSALVFLEGSAESEATIPVAMDVAREAGTHGALLTVPNEVLREKVVELIALAIASRLGHQWPGSRIGGRR